MWIWRPEMLDLYKGKAKDLAYNPPESWNKVFQEINK